MPSPTIATLPCSLSLRIDGFLAVRQDACDDLVHACLSADGLCRALVIAREHDDANAHVLQLADGLRAVFLDDIRHGDHAEKLAVHG